MSGPPAGVDQEVHATAGQETGATGPPPPAHRDNTAMNGAQLFKGQDESSGLMSGPPADVDQEVHATAGQETGATGPHPSRSSR